MFERTCDPTCIIIFRAKDLIIYYNIVTDEQWLIYGCCKQLGFCYEGVKDPKPELDCPVRPDFEGCCDLRGEYL